MKKLSIKQLKILLYVISALGICVGFGMWCFFPQQFRNTLFFHMGNGKYGSKFGALLFLPLQLIAFIRKDNNIEEIHTDDQEERAKLEAVNEKKILEVQVLRAIGLALLIWFVFGMVILIG